MSTKVVILFALLALVYAKECSEARNCLDNFLNTLSSDSQNEICRAMREAADCMKSTADACLGDVIIERVETQIKEMEQLWNESCGDRELSSEEEENICVTENKPYITKCLKKGVQDSLEYFRTQKITDRNTATCLTYSIISLCMIHRVEEKCGKETAAEMDQSLKNAPKNIRDACAAMRMLSNIESFAENKLLNLANKIAT